MKLAFVMLFALPAIQAGYINGCPDGRVCIDQGSVLCTNFGNGTNFCELYATSTQFDLEIEISADCTLEGDYFDTIAAGAGVFAGQGGTPCQVPVTGGVDGWYEYGSFYNNDFVQADATAYVPPPFDADMDVYQAMDCLGLQSSSGPGGSFPCGVVNQ